MSKKLRQQLVSHCDSVTVNRTESNVITNNTQSDSYQIQKAGTQKVKWIVYQLKTNNCYTTSNHHHTYEMFF